MRVHGGKAPKNTIDFSSPTNPLGPPAIFREIIEEFLRLGIYTKYPDYEYKRLREAIAYFYNIDDEHIVVLNGAAEALYLLLAILKPRNLIVFEPTFGDHRLACISQRINLVSIPYVEYYKEFRIAIDELSRIPLEYRDKCLVLLSNPNNPIGIAIDINEIHRVLDYVSNNCIIVVDEAFIDFTKSIKSSIEIDDKRIIVIRSLTKIFSIPGLRIGFMYINNSKILKQVDFFRQPWNVNAIASYLIEKAFTDFYREIKIFINKSIEVIETEKKFLYNELEKLNLIVYRSLAPYILVRHQLIRHPYLQQKLIRYGIFVRDASSYTYLTPYHSRISIKLRRENEILVNAFKKVFEEVVDN